MSDEYEIKQDDKFILPRDNQKLSLFAATSGMNAFFQCYHMKNVPDARIVAEDICATVLENPTVTDNKKAYAAIFTPAFIVGYRLTDQRLRRLSAKEQKHELKTVFAMDFTAAMLHLLNTLTTRMQEVGAQDIYDLVQKEGAI